MKRGPLTCTPPPPPPPREIFQVSFSNLRILNPSALLSVAAWVKDAQVTNVCKPIVLDAASLADRFG